MNIYELSMLCVKAINQKSLPGLEKSTPSVTLQMPPSRREARTRRLVPSGRCPIGSVLSRMGEYDIVVFDAVDLLAWCVANSNGGIKLEGGDA